MTQDERWNIRYEEVKAFIENNKRRPSKYVPEERNAEYYKKRPCAQKVESAARIFAEYLERKRA